MWDRMTPSEYTAESRLAIRSLGWEGGTDILGKGSFHRMEGALIHGTIVSIIVATGYRLMNFQWGLSEVSNKQHVKCSPSVARMLFLLPSFLPLLHTDMLPPCPFHATPGSYQTRICACPRTCGTVAEGVSRGGRCFDWTCCFRGAELGFPVAVLIMPLVPSPRLDAQ